MENRHFNQTGGGYSCVKINQRRGENSHEKTCFGDCGGNLVSNSLRRE
jgi:hypothetical protein